MIRLLILSLVFTSSFAASCPAPAPQPWAKYVRDNPPDAIFDLPKDLTPKERALGAMLGGAAGDAVGVTLEFQTRDSKNIADMEGGGPYGYKFKPGEWTDDTSMAVCMADSLKSKKGFDPIDMLDRWVKWMDEGLWSAAGLPGKNVDIGNTTRAALNFYKTQKAAGAYAGGISYELSPGFKMPGSKIGSNGSIMRLAPAAIRWHKNPVDAVHYSDRQGALTHGADDAIDATKVMGHMIAIAINGASKQDVLAAKGFDFAQFKPASKYIADFFKPSAPWRKKKRSQLKARNNWIGSAEFSLEVALWSILKTDNFEDAILTAVNFGDDADTYGAITGQIAGALFGAKNIPDKWRQKLKWGAEMQAMAEELYAEGAK